MASARVKGHCTAAQLLHIPVELPAVESKRCQLEHRLTLAAAEALLMHCLPIGMNPLSRIHRLVTELTLFRSTFLVVELDRGSAKLYEV